MSKSERFWDNRASNYEATPIKDEEAFQTKIENIRRYLNSSDTVLDYACGTGTISNMIARNVEKIHAIDISSKMIEFATEKAAALEIDNIQHSKATLFDDSLDTTQFDAVLAFNILHLSENIQEVIQRINDLLKPQGLLISSTPCLRGKFSLMGIVDLAMRKLGIVPNLNMPTFTELETAIQNGDFEIIEQKRDPKSLDSFLVAKKRNYAGGEEQKK